MTLAGSSAFQRRAVANGGNGDQALTVIMRDVGYDDGDVADLVEGTMKRQRLLDPAAILSRSPSNW